MNKKDWLSIAYVSIWVIVWGSVGSLIDYPLLQSKIYITGSLGQFSTFIIVGFISSIAAIKIFPKVIK